MGRPIAAVLLSLLIVSCLPQTDPGRPSPDGVLPTVPPPVTQAPGKPSPSIEVPPPITLRAAMPQVV